MYEIYETKERITADNDREAARVRQLLDAKGVFLVNLMSSPGAGKTTTLVRTIKALQGRYRIGVMSLPAKIQANWNAFLSYTFTENTWMMTGLSLVLLCAALKLRRMPGRHAGLAAVIAANILCLLASFAPLLYRKTGMQYYDAQTAACLDGGNSSAMMYNSAYVNDTVSMYGSRHLPTAVIVKGGN